MTRRFSSVRCFVCGITLVSLHRRDFRECGCPQETFVDGGSDYLRIGGRDLCMIEVLVDPAWPTAVRLDLLQQAHRLAGKLHCGFDPPNAATDDEVSHAIAWMTASLERAWELDYRLRDLLIDAEQWPPAPEGLGPLPAMIRLRRSRIG